MVCSRAVERKGSAENVSFFLHGKLNAPQLLISFNKERNLLPLSTKWTAWMAGRNLFAEYLLIITSFKIIRRLQRFRESLELTRQLLYWHLRRFWCFFLSFTSFFDKVMLMPKLETLLAQSVEAMRGTLCMVSSTRNVKRELLIWTEFGVGNRYFSAMNNILSFFFEFKCQTFLSNRSCSYDLMTFARVLMFNIRRVMTKCLITVK